MTQLPESKSSSGSQPRTGLSIRVSAYSYVAAIFVGTFFSALSIYLETNLLGYFLFGLSWIIMPVLALTDKIVFNGKRLHRSGLLPKAWAYLTRSRNWLKLKDVEQVETHAFPTIKRGGKVFYKYKTSIRGKGVDFTFSSGGPEYRNMVRAVLPLISENVLDNRSLEVRDYIPEPKQTRIKASLSNIPPADVLENSFRQIILKKKVTPNAESFAREGDGVEKANSLRILANELKLSGSHLQALETFRRAALLKPADAWLLFEFARCLQSFAGSEGNSKLERKAVAMMRLSELRAGNDGDLLARLGESYFQLGEWRRAGIAFQKAVEVVGEQFRSVRGLAEIALRDGKIAHVIHNFSIASRLAETPALRRWSNGEVEYFSRLNDDDEYMEMEIGRVNLLDSLDRWKRISLRLAFIGFPAIAVGLVYDDALIANCGWTLSTASLVLWTLIMLGRRVFAPRISMDLLEED
jgi:tetratricopeptide (TPR) repeat protein